MSLSKPEFVRTFVFDAAIGKNRFASASASNDLSGIIATASTLVIGATVEASDANNAAAVALGGVVKVVAGGTITRGDRVASDANGAAVSITIAASGTTLRYIAGVALQSGVSGDIIEVLLQPGYGQI